jgi:ATP-dependent RNA helicase RhlE
MKPYMPEHAMPTQFSEMELPDQLQSNLQKMGITNPTEVQRLAIPAVLSGNDFLSVAQTGSGKTLAYLLPVLKKLIENNEARSLVLIPNRETADQVFKVLQKIAEGLNISIALASSSAPVASQTSLLKKNPRIIVATPGRLGEHLKNNKLLLKGLCVLVLDEADRLLDMGFEPQLKFISSTLRGDRQTLMFAATFGPWAEPIAKLFMKEEAQLIRATAAEKPVDTLSQRVLFMTTAQKDHRLLDEVRKMQGGVIIFAGSTEHCVLLGRLLKHHEISSDFVHGDMNPGHRNRVLREFHQERFQVLVTSDLLARGIDVAHVQHVISYDLPYKAEDYLHRIGRTARAGKAGQSLTFVTPTDERTYRKMKKYLEGAQEETIARDFKFKS